MVVPLSMGLFNWLFTYILGGITFIPLVLLCSIAYTIYTSEPVQKLENSEIPGQFDDEKLLKKEKSNDNEEKFRLQATIRRTFSYTPPDPQNQSYVSSLRSLLATNPPKRKENVWMALKGSTLYIYEDEACTEVMDVIDVTKWDVCIWPNEGLLDGELYSKRNCIRLDPKPDDSPPAPAPEGEVEGEEPTPVVELPYFVFIPNLSTMESTYLTLLHSSHPSLPQSLPSIYSSADMESFIATLHSTSDPLPTRWFNTLLARLFFAYYKTDSLESAIRARLNKKLSKIKKPSWLTALSVPSVDVGTSPPMISKPMLKNLTSSGEASVELTFSYTGHFKITLSAIATFSLPSTSLSRARSYTVHLLLSVSVKKVEGNVLVLIKPPPSNRIWYAFTGSPKIELSVDPVVSDRQIKWSLVLGTIESRLREVVSHFISFPRYWFDANMNIDSRFNSLT